MSKFKQPDRAVRELLARREILILELGRVNKEIRAVLPAFPQTRLLWESMRCGQEYTLRMLSYLSGHDMNYTASMLAQMNRVGVVRKIRRGVWERVGDQWVARRVRTPKPDPWARKPDSRQTRILQFIRENQRASPQGVSLASINEALGISTSGYLTLLVRSGHIKRLGPGCYILDDCDMGAAANRGSCIGVASGAGG